MEQIGFVKNISKGKAEVEVKRISGCGGGCKSCGGCDTPSHTVFVKNNINAEIGDTVEIKGETKNILKYTLIVYMIPFVMLIIGITLGMKILKNLEVSNQEPLSFLIGLVFLALGYFIVKIFDKRIEEEDDNTITMTRII
jgi:sigma-E factor negative regulatory protein RseC